MIARICTRTLARELQPRSAPGFVDFECLRARVSAGPLDLLCRGHLRHAPAPPAHDLSDAGGAGPRAGLASDEICKLQRYASAD
eukprot:4567225-Pleurochrysis_carterae.AAC.1